MYKTDANLPHGMDVYMNNNEQITEDIEILSNFIVEANEHLEAIELKLLELENNPDDKEIINAVFRPFHTIKGISGFLKINKINTLCHHTENLIDGARAGSLRINDEIANIILEVVDTLKLMLEEVESAMDLGVTASFVDIVIVKLIDKIKTAGESERKVMPIGKILVGNGTINDDDLRENLKIRQTTPE